MLSSSLFSLFSPAAVSPQDGGGVYTHYLLPQLGNWQHEKYGTENSERNLYFCNINSLSLSLALSLSIQNIYIYRSIAIYRVQFISLSLSL